MTLAAMHHLAAERRAAAAAAVEAMPPPPARGAWGSGGGDAAELRLWQLHELLIARASVGVGSAAALMADVELLAAVLVSGADPQQLQFAQLVTQWRPVDKLRQQVRGPSPEGGVSACPLPWESGCGGTSLAHWPTLPSLGLSTERRCPPPVSSVQVTDGVLHPEQAHARLHSLLRVTALPEVQQLFGQPQALQRTREQLAAAQTVFSRPA
jgi:hypothetical protein